MATKRSGTRARAKSSTSTSKSKKSSTRKTSVRKSSTASMSVPGSSAKFESGSLNEKPTHSRKLKTNGIVALFLLLIAAGIFFLKDQVVVALVNGRPVMRWDVIRQLETQGGKEVLDGLVMQKLIEQEAQKKGVLATPDDLDTKIAEIETTVKDQGQELDALLELQGMTREDLRQQMRFQVLIEKLVGDEIAVTDEEIDAFIEEQKEFISENPDMDTVRADVRSLLYEQKTSDAASALTERLRQEAAINYLREY